MRKQTLLLLAVLSLAAISFSYTVTPENQARVILNKMIKAVEANKACTYVMRSNERIIGMKDLRGGNILTKVNVSPQKLYMKMLEDPNKGTEVLYVKGERGDKALVNPHSLVSLSIKLAPTGGLLTKDQHHTILSAGFAFTAKVVKDGMAKADAKSRFDEVFKYEGDIVWKGRNCYKIVVEDPTWGYTTYKAQKGETMLSIAQKLLICEYSMVELDGVKGFEEDLGGKTLKVPTSYAKKTIMYIDKANDFPIYQEMYDDKGVFERYEFVNLNINPTFKADEFSDKFPEYKF